MKKFLGRVIIIIQTLLGVINSFLIIKVLGVSSESDALLLSTTIMFSYYLYMVMPFEQFVFYFHRETGKNKRKEYLTYQYFFSVVISVTSILVFFFIKTYIVGFYTDNKGLSGIILHLLDVMIIGYSIYPICFVLEKHCSAIGKVNSSILLEVIPNIGLFIGLFISLIDNNIELENILYIKSLFYFVEFILAISIIGTGKFKFDKEYFIQQYKTTTIASNKVKLIKNIPTVIIEMMISRYLSNFGSGYVSIYYYANRFAVILKQIVIGPTFRNLQNKVSIEISRLSLKNVIVEVAKYLKESIALYLFGVFIIFLMIPSLFGVISTDKISITDINDIKDVFILLSISQVLIVSENALSFVLFSLEKIKLMFFNYIVSTIIFCLSLMFLVIFIPVLYSIGGALMIFYTIVCINNIWILKNEKNIIL